MKDYKLSELKEICSNNMVCERCPLCDLCAQLDSTISLQELEIDEESSKEELAQKIYDDIFAILKIKLWLYGDDAMTKSLNGLTKQKILDFTKKWGIKDNHLNEKDYSHIDHLQVHDKQIKEQASKETAEKILKPLYNVIMEHSDCCVNLSEDIKFLMEKYDIDLENEE